MNLTTRIWRYLFGEPKPVEVWKTTGEEFVRREKVMETFLTLDGPIHFYDVYAIYQVSLTTQNTRIVEDWRLA